MSKINLKFLRENQNFRKLSESSLSMFVVQGLELLLPLLLLPYVIRIIGLENFGRIAFAQAIVGYLIVVINYGFHLTATREIAINKDDLTSVHRILAEVSATKFLLFIGCFILLALGLVFFQTDKSEAAIFYAVFVSLSCNYLFPNFFFQGLHDLKKISIAAIIFKSLGVAMVFLLVRQKSDYLLYIIIPGISSFFYLVYSYSFIFKKYKFNFKSFNITWFAIKMQLKTGFYVFLSQLKLNFFSNMNVLIAGLLLGDKAAGMFGSADKVIKALSALQIPFLSALYPYFSNLVNNNKERAIERIHKIAIFGSVLYLIPIAIIFVFSTQIANILFGSEGYLQIAVLLRIMGFIPSLLLLTNLFGTQFLLNLNKKKIFLQNMFIGAMLNTVLAYPLTAYFGLSGAAFSLLLAEIFVCFLMFYRASQLNKHTN